MTVCEAALCGGRSQQLPVQVYAGDAQDVVPVPRQGSAADQRIHVLRSVKLMVHHRPSQELQSTTRDAEMTAMLAP